MSESISNIRSVPSTHPIKPVTGSKKDRKPGEQDVDREKPDEPDDQDKPILDEYV
jgi:hypothetical protein